MVDREHVEDQVLAVLPGLIDQRPNQAGADAAALMTGVQFDCARGRSRRANSRRRACRCPLRRP
jgi:hypothetical protein